MVVQAGSSPAAQALLGKTVAILGGAMYAQYRCIKAVQCLVLPPGTTPAEPALNRRKIWGFSPPT